MKRKELFEFEDFSWFPTSFRVAMTNLILLLHKIMGTTEVLSNLIIDLRKTIHFDSIVDLGSGSGGPMPSVVEHINEVQKEDKLRLLLTDLHPNPKLVKKINTDDNEFVTYHEDSINATNLSEVPKGLKTMIASFHHMNPEIAKNILKSASKNNEPILIYEIAKNNVPFVAWILLLPISLLILFVMTWVMTPFTKSITLTQLLFTYIIPIIPLAYAWDGQASLMRTYTFEDIELLLSDVKTSNYNWEINDAFKANGKKQGYYIKGYPLGGK
ncbi:hypothetical protein DIS18_12305 [Algibacter marinivivus]|uniref:Class I SAM-dependent methyltransferase n=1 Tax=Algibacter marinivivus TaxID=2100723 RepID=A0A2U2X2N6_9FLAO|nr:hypothetical protein [Algibacter marinivivus]PWH82042.1 hypothetical protein DIS18_12305 [Algibacter marinivivus]